MKNTTIAQALTNSANGLYFLCSEKSARRELFLLICSCICAVWIPTTSSFTLVLIAILMLAVESINTAIERLCDFIDQGFCSQIKIIKDLSAGAVLLLVMAYVLALVVFIIHT